MPAIEASVLLIGTGHWSNPGLDYHATTYDDMRSPHRQLEIAECIDLLAAFRPTAVALEIVVGMEAAYNADYRSFRAGTFTLTANERHQLGFRLADRAHLDRIHAIDWHNTAQDIGWDRAIATAETLGQQHLIAPWTHDDPDAAERSRALAASPARDQLLAHNDPAGLAASHRVYLDMARIGSGEEDVGAETILRWYERNMRMFVNIARLATSAESRIAVVVGSGHLPLLVHFLDGAGFQVELADRYLAS